MADYTSIDPYTETLDFINYNLHDSYKGQNKIRIGIICGSGLGGLSSLLKEPICKLDYKDIPHFGVSTVQGHLGQLIFGMLGNHPTVCMMGRKHVYEGHATIKTAYPVRIMKMMGVETLIVTNAAGGLDDQYNIGDIMIINDHISFGGLGGLNPLIGKNLDSFGHRFPSLSDVYDFELRVSVFRAAKLIGLDESTLREGVYAYLPEARFLRQSGCNVVGMSTVPEVVIAGHCGMRVLGLSLVTNRVAQSHVVSAQIFFNKQGDHDFGQERDVPIEIKATHSEVLETSQMRSKDMQRLVEKIVELYSPISH